jgi:hypothetical protein
LSLKKKLLAIVALFVFSVSTGFAAPINNLAQGQTAVGVGGDLFYVEHKLNDTFTLGYQNIDDDDLYGQLKIAPHLRGIIGTRDLSSGSDLYLGMAVNAPLAPEWGGYASLVAGSDFTELQLGANHRLIHNVDLNLNYRSFSPDIGKDKHDIDVGVTFKF